MGLFVEDVEQVSSSVKVIKNVTNIGIITDFGSPSDKKNIPDIYLVDSAGDSDGGKRIYRVLSELYPEGFNLKAIFCTHSNSDHIGGNFWLQQKTACKIWSSLRERGSVEYPFLEPALVWGAYPFKEIATKHFVAKESVVTDIMDFNTPLFLDDGSKIEFIHLPGHYFEMAGILHTSANDERILFLGDAIFGRHVIKKYWIPFLFDVKTFKETLEKIKTIPAKLYVPSHGDIHENIEALSELNLIAVLETEKSILEALKQELTAEELLKYIADLNGITLGDGQYVLIGSTLRSYLAYLQNEGLVCHFIRDNKMYWSVIK